ncbi:MAG: formimidoylglutamate deiminase [Acidobacteriota bacterium]
MNTTGSKTLYRPALLYAGGEWIRSGEVLVDEQGIIERIGSKLDSKPDSGLGPGEPGSSAGPNRSAAALRVVELPGKALLPGLVNAHSHAFQRLIRGRTESREGRATGSCDFWSWRPTMYYAAGRLDPRQVFDVARMAFLEMALSGITAVGEFHYLHKGSDGRAYDDPNLLARQVIAAAQSVGIRIVLLRCAYLRSGFELPPDPGQRRFIESGAEFLRNMEALLQVRSAQVHFGVAPHSLRAVPLPELREIAEWTQAHRLPLHMHVSEQLAENAACLREYGATPVTLLEREGLLHSAFTAVHAVHVSPREIAALARAAVTVCSCPTTERNLGDGFVPADAMLAAGVSIALGSDSQAQIDPLEDARQLEYHLRLLRQRRAILDLGRDEPAGQMTAPSLAARLFRCATVDGARSLGLSGGELWTGRPADFFTVDLEDCSIAGATAADLLPLLVFALNRSAVRDVVVQGRSVLRDGRHPAQAEIVERYGQLHAAVWSGAGRSSDRP